MRYPIMTVLLAGGIVFLFLFVSGCAAFTPLPTGDPAKWTKAQWQAKADSECIEMTKHPAARCVFSAPICTCELDQYYPGEIMPRVIVTHFDACKVLHQRGEL